MVDILYKAIAAECRSSVPELKKIYRDNIPQNMEAPCILVEITETAANGVWQKDSGSNRILMFSISPLRKAKTAEKNVKKSSMRCSGALT